jgi:hypothetical protein
MESLTEKLHTLPDDIVGKLLTSRDLWQELVAVADLECRNEPLSAISNRIVGPDGTQVMLTLKKVCMSSCRAETTAERATLELY